MSITVRPEGTDDVTAIRHVHDAAFGGLTEGRIVDDLRGTDAWLPAGSLVAVEEDGGVVGHLLLSRGRLVAADGSEAPIGIIGPVGVPPARQGEGIGTALMWRAIEVARKVHLPAICLLGHAEYYPRFGFRPARPLGIASPRPWPDPNWMALLLPDWDERMRGVVSLPPAFPDS